MWISCQVPDTNTFTLQDVCDEIGVANCTLQNCFDNANAAGFDVSYEGDKDSLTNFRNYNHYPTAVLSKTTYYLSDGNTETITISGLRNAGSFYARITLLSQSVKEVEVNFNGTIISEPNDYIDISDTNAANEIKTYNITSTVNGSATIRFDITMMTGNTNPTPSYIDVFTRRN